MDCCLCKGECPHRTAELHTYKASPERGDSPRGGEMPAGQRGPLSTRGTSEAGGGVLPRSAASGAAMSKPSGGICSLHSLSACGLPTPVVALACIGNVGIQAFFLCKRSTLFCTAFASLCIKPPLKGEGNQRSWWRGSPLRQPADFTRSYASFFLC